jgi:FKBP-type peptidyl-prolyl cis-trans isomerase SlyD
MSPVQIAKDTVVSFHYQVATADGQPVDKSQGEPLTYIHGRGQIVPGLEGRMDGRKAGEKFRAEVPAAEAYGELDNELDLQVPMEAFPEDARPHVQEGFRFQAEHPGKPGEVVMFRVCGLQGDQVFVSGNHPLAGQALVFDIEVAEVRTATEQELAHGHIHGGAGCHSHGQCCQENGGECGEGACGSGEAGKGGCCDDTPGCCAGH